MDNQFSRYAIYFIADPSAALHDRASAWLGWDCVGGREVPHPAPADFANPDGVDIAAVTTTPRKYGFHGTIKPPMRLADGVSEEMFRDRAAALAASIPPVALAHMKLSRLGSFLALVPSKPNHDFQNIASSFVTELDDLRAPMTEADLIRRRRAKLTDRQDALLQRWGYPYVLDEFRFHMTLSGALDEATADAAMAMLQDWLVPSIPEPMPVTRMAIAGEDKDGRFRVISWLPLNGQTAGC